MGTPPALRTLFLRMADSTTAAARRERLLAAPWHRTLLWTRPAGLSTVATSAPPNGSARLGTRTRPRRPPRCRAPRVVTSAIQRANAYRPFDAVLLFAASGLRTCRVTLQLVLPLGRNKLALSPWTRPRRPTRSPARRNSLLRLGAEFVGGILRLGARRMSLVASDGRCGSLLPRGGRRGALRPAVEFGGEPLRLGQGRQKCRLAGSSSPICATRECRVGPRHRLRAARRRRGRDRRRRLARAEAARPLSRQRLHELSC